MQDVSSLEGPPTVHRASTEPLGRVLSEYTSEPRESSEHRASEQRPSGRNRLSEENRASEQHEPLRIEQSEPYASSEQDEPLELDEYNYQTFLLAPPRIDSAIIDQSSFAHSSDFRIDYSDASQLAPPPVVRRRRSVAPREIIDFSSLDGPSLLEPSVIIDPGPSSPSVHRISPSPQSDAHWYILSKPLPPRPRSADSSLRVRRRMSDVYATSSLARSSLRSSLPSYDCTLQVASSSALQRAQDDEEKPLSPDELLIEEYLRDGLTRPPPYSNPTSIRRSRSLDPVVFLEDEGLWEVPQRWPSRNPPQRRTLAQQCDPIQPFNPPLQGNLAQQRNPAERQPAPMLKAPTDPPAPQPRLRPGRYYNGRSDYEDRKSSAKHDDGHHFTIRMEKVLPSSWRRARNLSGG
ncbi:hypothetical protein N7470_008682 [Penicillium chermesinum]|nr:hypothetical protein N7470_008682 [Penicillium chermesinum]